MQQIKIGIFKHCIKCAACQGRVISQNVSLKVFFIVLLSKWRSSIYFLTMQLIFAAIYKIFQQSDTRVGYNIIYQ